MNEINKVFFIFLVFDFLNPKIAEAYTARLVPFLPARIMVLNPQGTLISSSDPLDTGSLGQVLSIAGLLNAQGKNIDTRVDYSQSLNSEVVDVLVPVLDADIQWRCCLWQGFLTILRMLWT
jgi:hypothetical protein